MSVFSNWSYTAIMVVWEPSLDEFGQPSTYTRTAYDCSFHAGGKLQNDDTGEEFMPKTTIYFESTRTNAPKTGSYVIVLTGDEYDDYTADTITPALIADFLNEVYATSNVDVPPNDAEVIRSVMRHDSSTFNEGLPDYQVMTG